MFNRIVVFFRIKQILFILLLLVTNLSFSQSFNAGFIAGVNASQISGDNYAGFNKAGLLLGIYTDIDVSKKFNLQAEINYSQKGSRRNPNTSEGDTDFFLLRLDYIEIPIMLRVPYKRFKFDGGLYFGTLINQYLADEDGPIPLDDNINQFKDWDFGFLVGIDFDFTEHLIMNWRYNNSIVPVRDFDSGGRFLFNSGMFHSYLSISLRYEFYGE